MATYVISVLNDVTEEIKKSCKAFRGRCTVYQEIKEEKDVYIIQSDLNKFDE